MRFVWIIIWLPFFFYSCQGVKEERSVRLFHEKVKVNGEFMIGSPLEMKCLDDNLIIVDARSDAFFHWVRLPDFRYMGSFGQHGQGPGEWLKVKTLHALGNTLYSYDSYKSELFQVIPDEKLGMLSFRTSDIFQKSLTMDVFPLNANMLCAYGCFEKGNWEFEALFGSRIILATTRSKLCFLVRPLFGSLLADTPYSQLQPQRPRRITGIFLPSFGKHSRSKLKLHQKTNS